MIKLIFFLLVQIVAANLYCKIPKFGVGDEVAKHLNDLELVDCFKRQQGDDLYLKCWKDNELYNVDITIYVEGITI